MVRGLAVAAALVALLFGACGDDESSGSGDSVDPEAINDAAESGAGQDQEAIDEILAQLDSELGFEEFSSVGDTFVVDGDRCGVSVYTAGPVMDSVVESGSDDLLVAPDGSAAISLITYSVDGNNSADDTSADCLSAIREALDW